MNGLRVCMVVFLALGLMVQGCGQKPVEKPAEKPALQDNRNEQQIAELESRMSQARDDLYRQREENSALAREIRSIKAEKKELEEKLAEKASKEQERSSDPPPATEQPPSSQETARPETRVELLGAKAMAEFKAQRLSRRIDKLIKDLENKDKELNTIRENASQKEAEVARLSEILNRLQAEDQARAEEINSRLEDMARQLSERSAEAQRFKKELDERAALMATLKQSLSDAGKLKGFAEHNAEKLRSDLAETGARTKKLEKQLQEAVKEIERYQSEEGNLAQQAAQWRQAAEQFRAQAEQFRAQAEQFHAQAEQSAKETTRLKGEIAKFSRQKQVSQTTEDEPSPVDRILESPRPRVTVPLQESLY